MGRKFEMCKSYTIDNLPKRATKYSAGYDFKSIERVEIPSIWKTMKQAFLDKQSNNMIEKISRMLKPTLVNTGVKVKMENDEYLALHNRSSNPIKRFLLLANGVGIIDADYYSNPDNDGEIKFAFLNFGISDLVINQGDVIGQGVFHKFLVTDDDYSQDVKRKGGFGSTGE